MNVETETWFFVKYLFRIQICVCVCAHVCACVGVGDKHVHAHLHFPPQCCYVQYRYLLSLSTILQMPLGAVSNWQIVLLCCITLLVL